MSVFTHTPEALQGFRQGNTAAPAAHSSHIAMIKRFAAFALVCVGFAVVVTAVISVKLAVYLPHSLH